MCLYGLYRRKSFLFYRFEKFRDRFCNINQSIYVFNIDRTKVKRLKSQPNYLTMQSFEIPPSNSIFASTVPVSNKFYCYEYPKPK